ncbi:reverse transcriptase domain-containing protein [Psychrobacter sp. VH5]|uniref:reverse transcriptase domain-containing protein n=1 Tax=Psychrobacter sp. VH5 TaxID=3423439 RepID=UPI003D65DFF2
MNITAEMIEKAYKYLKTYAYNEKYNLFIKKRVAEFEFAQCRDTSNQSTDYPNLNYSLLEDFFQTFSEKINNENFLESEEFTALLNKIEVRYLPKRFLEVSDEKDSYKEENFYTNNNSKERYKFEGCNFIIDAPIEFHLLDVLWSLLVGSELDNSLSDDCYGNRLSKDAKSFITNHTSEYKSNKIYKYYFTQYDHWRRNAVKQAASISENNEDVAILSLDIKSFYYNLDIDFRNLPENKYRNLTLMLEDILKSYNSLRRQSLGLGSSKNNCNKNTLPIGFVSSSILGNYALKRFDEHISEVVRPSYYGRYVDDILMVFKKPILSSEDTIKNFIYRYLGKLIKFEGSELTVCLTGSINLDNPKIQMKKVVLQHFGKDDSKAGLKFLKKELDSKTSIINFHNSHIDEDLDFFAYKALYSQEEDHLKSLIGVTENKRELLNFLNSHILANKLCGFNNSTDIYYKIKHLFKGFNILRFYGFWHKIYEYLFVNNRLTEALELKSIIDLEIISTSSKAYLDIEDERYRNSLIESLEAYNNICFHLAKAPTVNFSRIGKEISFVDVSLLLPPEEALAQKFKVSNIFNHDLVVWPLINYSSYRGSFINQDKILTSTGLELDKNKVEYSPRFINFDELQLLKLLEKINSSPEGRENEIAFDFEQYFKGCKDAYQYGFTLDNIKVETNPNLSSNSLKIVDVNLPDNSKLGEIGVGIANIRIDESDIYINLKDDQAPNISIKRWNKLKNILESAKKNECDLLVLPEVSVPVLWLPYIISFSRTRNIGVIFGLEHWVSKNKIAYNLMIESLPYIEGVKRYRKNIFTARLKNHYSPREDRLINEYHLKSPIEPFSLNKVSCYHKVKWKGVSLATYNCYELADINHRAIFKNEIDLLVASVFNSDTNYYDHIMESVVRDLHCYVVQVNTSQYGGSCVLRPSKTELKKMLYLKGGENECVLKTTVDISKLRDFQFGKTGYTSISTNTFKSVPPGFNYKNSHKRNSD